jgi:hypothetical protein
LKRAEAEVAEAERALDKARSQSSLIASSSAPAGGARRRN